MGRARGSGAGLGATTNSGFSGGPVLSTRGPNAGGLEDGLAAALYPCWCSSGPRLGSGAQPTVEQVQKNLEATLGPAVVCCMCFTVKSNQVEYFMQW